MTGNVGVKGECVRVCVLGGGGGLGGGAGRGVGGKERQTITVYL